MPTIEHHPRGVIVNGKLFKRDAYYASHRVSAREWIALAVLMVGLAAFSTLVIGGLVIGVWWVVDALRRWL